MVQKRFQFFMVACCRQEHYSKIVWHLTHLPLNITLRMELAPFAAIKLRCGC